ncbi:MAG: hypothetical protein ACK5MT_11745 [Actinomycetales bacterium]
MTSVDDNLLPIRRAAAAFAEHIDGPGERSANALASALVALGDFRRADLLRAFAHGGVRTVPADWWWPGSVCHLDLDSPELSAAGELWFDPLEVSVSVATPWVREPNPAATESADTLAFYGWTSLEVVADWQLLGVHLVNRAIPGRLRELSGEQADDYCTMFSKEITRWGVWSFLLSTYGRQACRRIWGEPPEQLGGFTVWEGEMEVLRLHEIHEGPPTDDEALGEVSDIVPLNLPFRTTASVQLGLWQGPGTLLRTWQ